MSWWNTTPREAAEKAAAWARRAWKKVRELVGRLVERLKDEPWAVLLLVEAALYWGTEHGLKLSPGEQTVVLGVAASVLTLWTRQQTTPTRKLGRASQPEPEPWGPEYTDDPSGL